MNNKGFTMLEVLLTIMITSSMLVLTLDRANSINLDWLYFSNDYLTKQTDSLINKQRNDINDYSISFNENGKVNKAQTISVGEKRIVIHLGTGYFTYEE